jgi:hypothetical protein
MKKLERRIARISGEIALAKLLLEHYGVKSSAPAMRPLVELLQQLEKQHQNAVIVAHLLQSELDAERASGADFGATLAKIASNLLTI